MLLVTKTVLSQQFHGVNIIGLEEYPKLGTVMPKFQADKIPAQLRQLQTRLIESGYLSCSLDSVVTDSVTKKISSAYFYLGQRFVWEQLTLSESSKQLISETGYNDKLYVNRTISPGELTYLMTSILSYYENNGFPFVQLKLDNLSGQEGRLIGDILINKGPSVVWGKIEIKGDERVSSDIVKTIVGLREGELFSQEVLNEISIRLKETPYYEEIRASEYEFLEGKCNVYIYIRSKNANSLNAVVGVLPSGTNKINITGDARIKLLNVLNKAEKIDINWRKLMPLTQNLMVNFNYPFWFKSQFGSDIRFDLYKKDTSFIDLNLSAGISYFANNQFQLTGYVNSRRSDIISTVPFQNISVLPNFADVSSTTYGVLIHWTDLDYKFNPRKGIQLMTNISAGSKNIRKNASLPESIYDGISLNSSLVRGDLFVAQFVPLAKRSTLKFGLNGGGILNDVLFENELYRLGGLRTIRGFDEELIFASAYAIGTVEYRFLLEENSALFGFAEYGRFEQNTRTTYIQNALYSLGVGINFETKPGIFSLSYALGTIQNQPLLIRSAKIHFGFVNYF
jgi:outer membrane protein assembly factor BamA